MKWTDITVRLSLNESELATLQRFAGEMQENRGDTTAPTIERAIEWLVTIALMRESTYQQENERRKQVVMQSIQDDTPEWLRKLIADTVQEQL